MPTGLCETPAHWALLSLSLSLSLPAASLLVQARAATPPPSSDLTKRGDSHPLGIGLRSEDVSVGTSYAVRNPAYLPAQIGGIVGSYAFSLVVVALTLLALSKKRREHLRAAEELDWDDAPHFAFDFADPEAAFRSQEEVYEVGGFNQYHNQYQNPYQNPYQLPKSPGHDQLPHVQGHVRNFSLPSPTSLRFEIPNLEVPPEATSPSTYTLPSPTSTTRGPLGQDPDVDQSIVKRDRAMAQSELEQMYKYVMEQEEAKEAGVEFRAPALPFPAQYQQRDSSSSHRKERNKPANLNLSKPEKAQSRTSSILSALKSPLGKKKQPPQGISISSPIMTPMTGTFPNYAGEEMNSIPPRQYAPARPPPVPTEQLASFSERRNAGQSGPMTPPDLSPESTQSIDERIGAIATVKGKDRDVERGEEVSEDEEDGQGRSHNYTHHQQHNNYSHPHSRHISLATTEADPVSAVSETSQAPLVRHTAVAAPAHRTSGLPTSPKPGVNRFPSLPSSPKPGASFSRPNAPSAVRTGGALPLRAYEPAGGLLSPRTYDRTVKQTVFERAGPMSPGGMHTARTPLTGNPVPYSPYQPFSPVIPITPSLVTKADRKRMRRMEPKTPTLQMVKSDDELW